MIDILIIVLLASVGPVLGLAFVGLKTITGKPETNLFENS